MNFFSAVYNVVVELDSIALEKIGCCWMWTNMFECKVYLHLSGVALYE